MSLKKKINKLIQNRPKYKVDPSYANNVAIAKSQAFGRNQSIVNAEENIANSTADLAYSAGSQTNSSAGILATINSLSQGQNRSFENLAGQEAGIQQQNIGMLYGANNALAEENDKAFEYNVNEPYQNKLAELRERRKNRQETVGKIFDTVGSIGINAITGGFGKN